MGNSETKPSYPTEKQWMDYQASHDDKLNSELSKVDQETSDLREMAIDTVSKLSKMMEQCNDKSTIHRVFFDNTSCTKAREEFMMTVVNYGIEAVKKEEITKLTK